VTDAQLISLVVALAVTPLMTLVFVVLGRNWERSYIQAEVGRTEERLLRHLTEHPAASDARFTSLEHRIERMESALLGRMADLDNRLQKLEAK
jgi:hypothetical protein